jgi:archaemetzincin
MIDLRVWNTRMLANVAAFLCMVGLGVPGISSCSPVSDRDAGIANSTEATRFSTNTSPSVALQPLGSVNQTTLVATKKAIDQSFHVEVTILAPRELPAKAYYKPRKRYRASLLLEALDDGTDKGFTKVVGLTAVDISVTKGEHFDWGVFGLGALGGRPCVVSTYRLGHGRAHRDLFLDRLGKVMNHELGHTFGLPHCPTTRCLMQDANGMMATVDGANGDLCATCRTALQGKVALVDQ